MTDNEKSKANSSCWPPSNRAGGRRQSGSGFLTAFLRFFSGLKGKKQSPGANQISSPDDLNRVRLAIKNKYAEVAVSAGGKFKYPTGREGAEALGYDNSLIRNSQNELMDSFCGVGNPFAIAKIEPVAQVLDIGCGAGFDLLVASNLVGESGKVCGIDLTEDMVNRATRNMALASVTNVEIRHVDEEDIPYPDQTFDVVISNGVINLSPCKNTLFKEIFRVLKPEGRLQFADIIMKKALPESLAPSPEAWAQWIGGTVPVRDQINLMEEAGFQDVEFLGETGFATSEHTGGALFIGHKKH